MSETIIVAIIALAGTALGTFGGIRTTSKLIVYRLEQLEKKVGEHNGLERRLYIVEGKIETIAEIVERIEKKVL